MTRQTPYFCRLEPIIDVAIKTPGKTLKEEERNPPSHLRFSSLPPPAASASVGGGLRAAKPVIHTYIHTYIYIHAYILTYISSPLSVRIFH